MEKRKNKLGIRKKLWIGINKGINKKISGEYKQKLGRIIAMVVILMMAAAIPAHKMINIKQECSYATPGDSAEKHPVATGTDGVWAYYTGKEHIENHKLGNAAHESEAEYDKSKVFNEPKLSNALTQFPQPVVLGVRRYYGVNKFTEPWPSSRGMGKTAINQENWWKNISVEIENSGISIGNEKTVKDQWAFDCSSYFSAVANGTHGAAYPEFSGSGNTEWIYNNYLNPALGKCELVVSGYAGCKNSRLPINADSFTNGTLRDGDVIMFSDKDINFPDRVTKHIAIICSGGFAYDNGTGNIKWIKFYNYMGWLRYGEFETSASAAPYWAVYRPSAYHEETWPTGLAIKKTDINGEIISEPATFEVKGENGFCSSVTTVGGYAWVGGLQSGNYTVTETDAPDGFLLNTKAVTVHLTAPVSYRFNGKDIGGVFNESEYKELNADVAAANISAIDHFTTAVYNGNEQRRSSVNFDVKALRENNPDLNGNNKYMIDHFLNYGKKEARRTLSWDEIFQNNEGAAYRGIIISDEKIAEHTGMIVLKKEAKGLGTPVSGARYEITRVSSENNNSENNTYGNNRSENDNPEKIEVVTDGSGFAMASGLKKGEYQVQEISAPKGFGLDENCYRVNVDPYRDDRFIIMKDGQYYYMDTIFNPVYYAGRYKDLCDIYGDGTGDESAAKLFQHFNSFGIKEGRCASSVFNLPQYYENYTDLRENYGKIYVDEKGSKYRIDENKQEGEGNNQKYYYHYARYGFLEKRWGNTPAGIWNEIKKATVNPAAICALAVKGVSDIKSEEPGIGGVEITKLRCSDKTPMQGVKFAVMKMENVNDAQIEDFNAKNVKTEKIKAEDTKAEEIKTENSQTEYNTQKDVKNKCDYTVIVTDENGYASTGNTKLHLGRYMIKEIMSSENAGMQMEDPVEFEITPENPVVMITSNGVQPISGLTGRAADTRNAVYNVEKPLISTKAVAINTASHIMAEAENQDIKDEIQYYHLKADTEYTVVETLKLVNKDGTVENYDAVKENPVKVTFRTTSEYLYSRYNVDGIVEANFSNVNGKMVPENSKLVVYSDLYLSNPSEIMNSDITTNKISGKSSETDAVSVIDKTFFDTVINANKETDKNLNTCSEKENFPIRHEDPDNDKQTIIIPHISTNAQDMKDGDKNVSPEEVSHIKDDVTYMNLIPGNTYYVKGKMVDLTGKNIKSDDGKIEKTVKFIAEKNNGTVCVEFDVTFTEDFQGKDVTLFEKLYTQNGIEIANHEVTGALSQTIHIGNKLPTKVAGATEEKIEDNENVTTEVKKYEKTTEKVQHEIENNNAEDGTEENTEDIKEDTEETKKYTPQTGDDVKTSVELAVIFSAIGITAAFWHKKNKE